MHVEAMSDNRYYLGIYGDEPDDWGQQYAVSIELQDDEHRCKCYISLKEIQNADIHHNTDR